MSVRTSLRLGSALLGLSLVAAACSGAAGTAGTAGNGSSGSTLGSDSGASGTGASAQPTFDLGSLLSPDPGQASTPGTSPATAPSSAPVAQQPTQKPAGPTAPAAISTTKASSLLSQVDHLL
ncbi:MAG TPA: hypothetical protein VKR24_12995, partial [Candidatus Limnocylindrales bacterium]|nr:hypothetical protein [Candidatus Limnocylindrales bacterium]